MTGNDLSTISGVYVGSTPCKAICKGSTVIWKLPYDAEIEYLEASGTQHIDTGIINDATVTVDMKMSAQGRDMLSGAEPNTNNRYKWGINGNGYLYYGFLNSYASSTILGSINTPYLYHILAGNSYVKDMNDTIVISGQGTNSQFSSHSITLLRCYSGTKFVSTSSGTIRMYYCNITKSSNNTDMQLIPVRVGNVGYMYDKVSGQLYGNAGSGSFTLGPDVALTIPTA